jgi:DNA-binding NtrC family response regulator
MLEDRGGDLWLGTDTPIAEGVSRYRPEGEEFVTFTAEDGLADNIVHSIWEDREGVLWFGTWGGGVSRYDGTRFTALTTEDGLADNRVSSIVEDREGMLWFGTYGGGVSRYDGETFATFTTEDGLAGNVVESIFEDREGHLWFGTDEGMSRYDGETFMSFTTEDGLVGGRIWSMHQDREGVLWFGSWGGGVSRYDGLVFQRLSRRDGLGHDAVHQILQDRHGAFWIGTERGVTRYRPYATPPAIRLKEVIADRRYEPAGEIHVPASQTFVIFEFQGRSLTTRPDGMAYVYRLEGYDPDWKPNYTGRVEYQDLPIGEYTFQVKAVDRDLNYSEPATVRVVVEPDPRLEAFADALSGTFQEFVGDSDALRQVQDQLLEVAATDLTVLILGETGTGKGLAARTLHGLSPRKAGPFILVSCGAIPQGLMESELFGHERGAFTGAISRKLGKVELAEGGTLFLDEIGDLALEAQAKLLQFLEERTFQRVGGTEILRLDVRVIAATNRDLRAMVEARSFREDLYFRLQEYVVEVPPLRDRRGDIADLADCFMEGMARHLNRGIPQLTPGALSALQSYDWPGNVRELEHVVKRAVVVCRGSTIRAQDITLEFKYPGGRSTGEIISLEEHERGYILEVLEQTGWVVKGPHGAAARLGLPESTLRNRMKKLGIHRT